MRVIDLLATGVRNLLKRKARTILTTLGVVIGASAIIVMMSLGVGMTAANMAAVERYASVDEIELSQWYTPRDEDGNYLYEQETVGVINDAVIAQIATFPEVDAVTPFMYADYSSVVSGKYKMNYAQIIGVDASVMDKFGFDLAEGTLLTPGVEGEAIFGYRVPYNFYNTRSNARNRYAMVQDFTQPPSVDVFNDKIVMTTDFQYGERRQPGDTSIQKPLLHQIKAVGVLAGDETMYSQYDDAIIMDIKTLLKMKEEDDRFNRRNNSGNGGSSGGGSISFGGGGYIAVSSSSSSGRSGSGSEEITYQSAKIKAATKTREDIEAIVEKVNEMGLGAYSQMDQLIYLEETTNQIQLLLGAISIVALLVAAIGIANTMIMSVYERTKEIAVMKVLGCRLGNIGALFLFEAGLIGFLGGALAVGLSELASYLLNEYGSGLLSSIGGRQVSEWDTGFELPPISIIPLWLIGLGLAFATVVGLVFGFLPARRAMKLSVLKAIHND